MTPWRKDRVNVTDLQLPVTLIPALQQQQYESFEAMTITTLLGIDQLDLIQTEKPVGSILN